MKKILIVDDSLMDRKLLRSVLKKSGIENEIIEAVDGEEAIKLLSEYYKDVGLILLDWQMPKISGMEFMEAVMKVPLVASIPIVMITASSSEENKKQAYTVNPNLGGYVVKPYKPEKLIETILAFLK